VTRVVSQLCKSLIHYLVCHSRPQELLFHLPHWRLGLIRW
jgi:hypothetical protein